MKGLTHPPHTRPFAMHLPRIAALTRPHKALLHMCLHDLTRRAQTTRLTTPSPAPGPRIRVGDTSLAFACAVYLPFSLCVGAVLLRRLSASWLIQRATAHCAPVDHRHATTVIKKLL